MYELSYERMQVCTNCIDTLELRTANIYPSADCKPFSTVDFTILEKSSIAVNNSIEATGPMEGYGN